LVGLVRVAFLGPSGTFTEEALRASASVPVEEVPAATVREAVMAVQEGAVDRAVVPIENVLEGSVRATLDTLAGEAPDVRIEAQVTHPIHHCVIAREQIPLEQVVRVVSHPHAMSQCRRFVGEHLPQAERSAATSTAEAVRQVSDSHSWWAALGSRLSAERYGCRVLADGVEDRPDNLTRFVWLTRANALADQPPASPVAAIDAPTKTSIVFWGFDDDSPGALVAVLAELADRRVNLTKIESRPRRVRLGHYMFFADLDGAVEDSAVHGALEGLGRRVESLRVLGSYPAG
jgi:prephenate dehydratase